MARKLNEKKIINQQKQKQSHFVKKNLKIAKKIMINVHTPKQIKHQISTLLILSQQI